jgi:hypothetical protein
VAGFVSGKPVDGAILVSPVSVCIFTTGAFIPCVRGCSLLIVFRSTEPSAILEETPILLPTSSARANESNRGAGPYMDLSSVVTYPRALYEGVNFEGEGTGICSYCCRVTFDNGRLAPAGERVPGARRITPVITPPGSKAFGPAPLGFDQAVREIVLPFAKASALVGTKSLCGTLPAS